MNRKNCKLALAPFLIAPLVFLACSGKTSKPSTGTTQSGSRGTYSASTGALTDRLTQEEAVTRQRQIARPSYTLWFGLDATNEDYEGRAVITFDLKSKARDFGKYIFLDFSDGLIRSMKVNGVSLSDDGIADRYNGRRIQFKISDLEKSANRIEIAFTRRFVKDGYGFYRFKDPQDGKVYLYTNFEPFGAHRAFPCFDQPDLKASFELTVEAPEDWKVISNMPERASSRVDGKTSWAFPPSPIIATYVFALQAGPFKEWKKVAEGVPFRLFARASLAQYVDPEDWFTPAIKGMEWYGVQFGVAYPYAKYDQVIVPELMAGAMENVAAVTFNERYVHRSKLTEDQRGSLQSVILHELAHMWFGNLVTLKWWNMLWLNESFADIMAYRAQAALGSKSAWIHFATLSTPHALSEDQLVTTHPIEGPVPDTDAAETVFDGISYGKGASVIHQLESYLGEEDFREGVQRYFMKHALRNATTADFFAALGEASSKSLASWQKLWIQTQGPNTLKAEWACEEGKLTRFKLIQGNAETSHELRPHHTQVALYRKTPGGSLMLAHTEGVTYSQAETEVPSLVKKKCPDFVFPNYQSEDFAKVILDPTSLETVKSSLSKLSDPILRGMLWATLNRMRIDAQIPPIDYAELVFQHAPRERDSRVLRDVLASVGRRWSSSLSVLKVLPEDQREDYLKRLESFALKNLRRAPAGSDLQKHWFELALDSLHDPEGIRWATELLKSKKGYSRSIPSLRLDPEKRWDVIFTLASLGAISQEKIDEELRADPTQEARAAALNASLVLPDPESKKKWLDRIYALTGISAADLASGSASGPFESAVASGVSWPLLEHALYSYHQVGQENLTRASVNAYFEMIPKLSNPAYKDYAAGLATTLFPYLCDAEIANRAQAVLDSYGSKLPAAVVKELKYGKQIEEHCIRNRALVAGSKKSEEQPTNTHQDLKTSSTGQ